MTIGQRLKNIRENLGLSQDNMANFVGCHPRSWKGYEADSSIPGGEILSKLAETGADINWILGGNKNKPKNAINVYDVEFSAGCGSFIAQENIKSNIVLPNEFFETYSITPETSAGVLVRGDSMQPKFFDGDIAILDITIKQFTNDGIYAFIYDGACFIKKIQLVGNEIKATSINPLYEAWIINPKCTFQVVGKVKAGICKF